MLAFYFLQQEKSRLMRQWQCVQDGAIIHIDSKELPKETIVSIDLETNELEPSDPNFKITCIGMTGDGINCYVYFNITPELIEYLKAVQMVAHSAKNAEIPWLERFGVTIDQLYYDTKIASYVYDSARKNNGLKALLKDLWGVDYPTYDEMVTSEEFIHAACDEKPELMIQSKSGPKYPKKVLLEDQSKEVVAAYNSSDCFYTFRLWKWLEANMSLTQKNFYNTIELPTTKLLYLMEKQGVMIDTKEVRRIHNAVSKDRRKDKATFIELLEPYVPSYISSQIKKMYSEELDPKKREQKIEKLKNYEQKFKKIFNINSPLQVLPLLQEAGLDIDATNEDTLVRYGDNALVKSLLEYRGKQKVCSTYTIPLYFNSIKDRGSRIHAHFNQNTITGRLSSSDPINLQNQPPAVRSCFVAKEDHVFIGGDLNNLEIRLPTHLSGEPKWIEEYHKPNGGDVHRVTMEALFGKASLSLPKEEYDAKRAKAKTCNFLLTNSGTPYGLANELQCSVEEAEGLYAKFWEGYPVMAAWLKEEKRLARANGGISSYFGRWVNLPQLSLWCGDPSCGKKKWSNCKQCKQREEAESTAISIRVQGTGGDMVKLAALRLYREYGYIPVLSIHDELTLEIPIEKSEEACYTLKRVMESIVQLRVPLVSNVKVGKSWKDCH